ncbi:hypothetical protein HQ489_00355 [Candidatus Woesearchaeota archaeon]|nr:hypothetical protein [Candidatus Woesearchaeota archaeon]
MLEKLMSEERHSKLARFHPSSKNIFVDNETFDYVTNQVLNTRNKRGWKKIGIGSLNGIAHIGYGVLEGVSRLTESGLRLAGGLVERIGSTADDKLQAITTDQYDDEINWPKSISRNARKIYGNIKNGFQKSTSQQARNKMMVGLSLIVGLNLGYKILPNVEFFQDDGITVVEPTEPLPPTPRLPQTQPSQIDVNNLSNFSDQNVLIYCANDDERISVRDTLRSRNARLTHVREGIYKTRLNGSNVDIVVQGSTIPQSNYGVIQLRGHTSDMIPLSERVENSGRRNHLLVLGGCNSAGYIGDLARSNRPVIGSNGTQDSSQNTYLLAQLLQEVGTARSWSELSGNIKSQSERARYETTFPGDTNYRH